MNRKIGVVTMMAMLLGHEGFGVRKYDRAPRPAQYPFTPEESNRLARMSGRDKKAYLKLLKNKYSKPVR